MKYSKPLYFKEIVFVALLILFIPIIAHSSCPSSPIEFEQSNGSNWVPKGKIWESRKWDKIFEDIRNKSKAYYSDGFCCNGKTNNNSVRVIYKFTCDQFYYLTNASKSGKSNNFTLYWMENNGHFENKVLECAVPKSVAKRINAMLIDEKGNLKPIPPLKINGSEGN